MDREMQRERKDEVKGNVTLEATKIRSSNIAMRNTSLFLGMGRGTPHWVNTHYFTLLAFFLSCNFLRLFFFVALRWVAHFTGSYSTFHLEK